MAFDFEQGNDPVIEQQKATLARKIKDALAKLAQLLKGKR